MTSTLRARVLDALPGYRQQEHRHDQLRAMHQNIPTAPGAFANDYLERIAAAADNDGRDLDTLATSSATDRAAWAAAAEFNGLISQARDRAWHAWSESQGHHLERHADLGAAHRPGDVAHRPHFRLPHQAHRREHVHRGRNSLRARHRFRCVNHHG